MTTVLILGGAAPLHAGHGRDLSLKALSQLKARGSRVVVTDTAQALKAAPEYAELADETHAVDYMDPAACVAWALEYSGQHPVEAVMGFREYSVVAVAEVAAALGLAGNPPELVRTVRTKDLCRQALRGLGFPQPAVTTCTGAEEIGAFLSQYGGPVVVKPRDAAGSEGVSLVEHPGQAAQALAFARGGTGHGSVLVEEFVDGPEFSVEGLFVAGRPRVLAITRKVLADGTFVEAGHVLPDRLPPDQREAIAGETSRALSALGLNSGIFHVECWYTADGPVLGEVHVRPGGDWLHAMVEWSYPGLELFGALHDDLLGLPVSLPDAPRRGAAVRFVTPPPGVVTAVRGWDVIAGRPGLIAAELNVAPGAVVAPLTASSHRVGTVCLGAADADTAERELDLLMGHLTIDTRPGAPSDTTR